MDYRIKPIEIEGFAPVDGIHENDHGAWVGETDFQGDKVVVMPYADEDGNYLPAPENWHDLIIETL